MASLEFELTKSVLRLRPVGDVDLGVARQGLSEALTAARAAWRTNGNRSFHVLINLRESLENRSAGELRGLSEIMAGYVDVLTGRIALVVVDPLRYALSRTFEVIAESVGQTPRVFESIDEAETWLAEPA